MSNDPEFDEDERSRINGDNANRQAAVLVHWGGYITWILVPWILLATQADRRSLVAWHAREALNFQLTQTIYAFLATLAALLALIDFWLILVSVGLILTGFTFELVVVILASIAAWRGERYRCPLTIRFVSAPQEFHDSDDHEDRE
jgi:uncharacterized Tic20 family protein